MQIDHGALQALRQRGASLLPSGIKAVSGSFEQGDAIDILLQEHDHTRTVGKGICQYDAAALNRIRGLRSEDIARQLGDLGQECAIHRDDLVLYPEQG